jgi:hypothetical protein
MTIRRVLVTLAALFVVGLTATSAQAQTIRFTAALSGANETPGIITGAFGTATVTLDTATQTLSWNIDVYNLPSGINNAHFHVAGPGVAGPTVVNIPFTANQSNDFNLNGSATPAQLTPRADQGIRSWDDFMQALQGGQTYINIHTAVNGGGEIRGQVIRVP